MRCEHGDPIHDIAKDKPSEDTRLRLIATDEGGNVSLISRNDLCIGIEQIVIIGVKDLGECFSNRQMRLWVFNTCLT